MQIRSKLTLQFILIVAGILLISLFFIYFRYKSHVEGEFYANLRSKAFMMAELLVKTQSDDSQIEQPLLETNRIRLPYKENFIIYNDQLQPVYSFNPTPDKVDEEILREIIRKGELQFIHGSFHAIGVRYTNKLKRSYIVVSESVFNDAMIGDLRNILIFDFFFVIAIVALGGWLFAGQALAPVSSIMNQMDDILPSDLSKRLETTERKDELSRLARTFNNLLDRIQQAFDLQKSFLSNVSHELKNPLTVIISQLDVKLSKTRSAEEYRQTLQSVLDDVRELSLVSEQLMQLARLNTNVTGIPFERLRLDEVVWQAKSMLLKNHPEYTIHFEVSQLPEDEETLWLDGNEQLLRTAIINLLDNGCKFSPEKTVRVRLLFDPEGRLNLQIIDTGPGISPEDQQRIFEPFYRSPATTTVKGSGIGLSLVNSILKLHRISLQVSSDPGKGSTFRLILAAAGT